MFYNELYIFTPPSQNISFYKELGDFAIKTSIFTMKLIARHKQTQNHAKTLCFTMNSEHVSKTTVFTMNYAFFPNINCVVQKRHVSQWIMLSFSKTSVFTTNYPPCSFSKNNMFYNELCDLFTKTTVFTMNFTILRPFWHRAGPEAEQSRAEPSRTGTGRAEPSRAGPGRAEPS